MDRREVRDDGKTSLYSPGYIEHKKYIKGILERNLTGTEPDNARKAKLFYESCMDKERNQTLLIELFKKDFESLGGWPVLEGEAWDGKDFDWIDILLRMRQLGYEVSKDEVNGLFVVRLWPDKLNQSVKTIHMLKFFYTIGEKVKKSILFGADNETAMADMRDVREFEITLYKNPYSKNISHLSQCHLHLEINCSTFSVKELQDLAPQANWLKLFNGFLSDPIYENDTVNLYEPEFFFWMAELFNKTDKRVGANYLFLQAASFYYDMFLADPSEEDCESRVSFTLQPTLITLMTKKYIQDPITDEIHQWSEIIKKEYVNMLDDADWMDSSSKNRAKEKVLSIVSNIGIPKEFYNDSFVTEMHKNLNITKGSWRDNYLKASKFYTDLYFGGFRKPYNPGEWIYYNFGYHTGYISETNGFIIQPHDLQKPFVYKGAPKYVNFGVPGYTIGHEIGHAFDGKGPQSWETTTKELYAEKAKCIIEQYSNYTTDYGFQVNGKKTINDDVADNLGYKAAFLGYQSWVKDNGKEASLPGLKYSPNQLFWIRGAQVWCDKLTPKMEKDYINEQWHSPRKFRVIGPYSNLPEFANDFKCSVNSNMNPQNKCKLW